MFPPTYIPNDSERVSLYRELDKMEEERDILAFTERLKDRFGKVPKEGKELIRVVRLRRMAKTLGMEKVILKKGQMSIFSSLIPKVLTTKARPSTSCSASSKSIHANARFGNRTENAVS